MQGHIGLNEVAIGISVPLYWGRLMARVIGDRKAEHLCMNATLLPPPEALKVVILCLCITVAANVSSSNIEPQLCPCGVCSRGSAWSWCACELGLHIWCCGMLCHTHCMRVQVGLIDQVVPSDQLMPAVEAAMLQALKQPDSGRMVVKLRFRESFAREWEQYPDSEVAESWDILSAAPTVKALEATLQRLSGKKGRAKL